MREYSNAAPIPSVTIPSAFRVDAPTPVMQEALRHGQQFDKLANNRFAEFLTQRPATVTRVAP